MHRLIEVENILTFERHILQHQTLKKDEIFENEKGKWKVLRVYMKGDF